MASSEGSGLRLVQRPCEARFLGLEIGARQSTLPVGAKDFRSTPHIALSGAFLALLCLSEPLPKSGHTPIGGVRAKRPQIPAVSEKELRWSAREMRAAFGGMPTFAELDALITAWGRPANR